MFDLREIITLTSKRSKHQIPKAKILDEEHVHLPSAQHSTLTNINFCTRLTAKGAAIAAFLICRSHLHIHCRFSRLMQCKATRMSILPMAMPNAKKFVSDGMLVALPNLMHLICHQRILEAPCPAKTPPPKHPSSTTTMRTDSPFNGTEQPCVRKVCGHRQFESRHNHLLNLNDDLARTKAASSPDQVRGPSRAPLPCETHSKNHPPSPSDSTAMST